MADQPQTPPPTIPVHQHTPVPDARISGWYWFVVSIRTFIGSTGSTGSWQQSFAVSSGHPPDWGQQPSPPSFFPAPQGKVHNTCSLDDEQSEPGKDVLFDVTGGFQAKPGAVGVNNPQAPSTLPFSVCEHSGPTTDENMEYDWRNLLKNPFSLRFAGLSVKIIHPDHVSDSSPTVKRIAHDRAISKASNHSNHHLG